MPDTYQTPVPTRRGPDRSLLFGWLAGCVLLLTAVPATAGDWPSWRGNAGHTAAAADALNDSLSLEWVRVLPPPRPAWPKSQTKLQFDLSYEPIVVGGRVYIGSTVNDTITAYDARTGDEIWRFYTNGPVRFAPVLYKERLYAVSDDGYLYCLNATDGTLVWKVNGGPADRPILGNERLVSTWPARGGAVVADGVVYFTTGIWPSMGIFIHAVDATTGRILWTNSRTGSQFVVHPHGASSFGSVVPQGYLAAAGDTVIVPGGRSQPALLDRATGKMRYFEFGAKSSGGYDVLANDRVYAVSDNLYRLSDGLDLGPVAANVLDGEWLFGIGTGGTILVQSTEGEVKTTESVDRRGRKEKKTTFTPRAKWQIKTASRSQPARLHAKAGNVLYTSAEKRVMAFRFVDQEHAAETQDPVWSAHVEGNVWGVVPAEGRLYVVTEDGVLSCFGPETKQPVRHPLPAAAAEIADDAIGGQAAEILALPGANAGYAIALGIPRSNLIEQLVRRSSLFVMALDPSAEKVDAFRREMDRRGLYGTRVSAHVGDLASFPFPPYLANLVVCTQPELVGFKLSDSALIRLYHPLRPYGGVACLAIDDHDHDELAKAVASAKLPNAIVGRHAGFSLVTRSGPLPGAGTWSHQYADAANSVVSQDELVKAPLGVLWWGGPSNDKVLPRHGHGPSPQVAGGRLFIEGPHMLRAVDAYTGRLLWEREFQNLGQYYDITAHFPGAGEIGSNYVSLPESVYVVYGSAILELDAATGEKKREFTLPAGPDGTPGFWGSISIDGELLVATSTPVKIAAEEPKQASSDALPAGFAAVFPQEAPWAYLAGSDPPDEWTQADYQLKDWKEGPGGFGFADNDDRTILRDMRDKYQRVYIRRTFDAGVLDGANVLALAIKYDDGFIAYLNGKEVARGNVEKGRGAEASRIAPHEASNTEYFDIADFRALLKPTGNVLAIEGHNESKDNGDFTLDCVLIGTKEQTTLADALRKSKPEASLDDSLMPVRYASASKRLVVFNRQTGEQLWARDAIHAFRHNCIVVANDAVYCIDAISPLQRQMLLRRGVNVSGQGKLLALNARTGNERWSTEEDVFGTFLNYSAEYDVLLQGGSANRDRAKDETDKGLVAYQGKDGTVLWKDLKLAYSGPCLLWKDKIITNGDSGFRLELLTGKNTGWTYRRMHGCNSVIGSKHLLTFRSGAAGFCDLAGDSGTGNLGGFRSSCTSNLIPADGILSAPDFTRTCICSYQNQCSLAFVHMPDAEFWTFNAERPIDPQPERLGFNLGAPGDRRSDDGTLWFEYPSSGGPTPKFDITVEPAEVTWFNRHSATVAGDGLKWVAASGAVGINTLRLKLSDKPASAKPYTVRLVFLEPEEARPGERIFSVSLQGQEVLADFDVARAAGGSLRTVVRTFTGIKIDSQLEVQLTAAKGNGTKPPVLCGVELVAEKE